MKRYMCVYKKKDGMSVHGLSPVSIRMHTRVHSQGQASARNSMYEYWPEPDEYPSRYRANSKGWAKRKDSLCSLSSMSIRLNTGQTLKGGQRKHSIYACIWSRSRSRSPASTHLCTGQYSQGRVMTLMYALSLTSVSIHLRTGYNSQGWVMMSMHVYKRERMYAADAYLVVYFV